MDERRVCSGRIRKGVDVVMAGNHGGHRALTIVHDFTPLGACRDLGGT